MKISIHIIIFLMSFQSCLGQRDIYSCKSCGMYTGKFDSIEGDKISHIFVKLSLEKDSIYSYEIGGVFSWCASRTFYGTGKWFAEGDWIYFKPDTTADSGRSFVMDYTVSPDKRSKDANAIMFKYSNKGYDHVLMATQSAPGFARIFFRIAVDCFKSSWSNSYAEQQTR